MTDVTWLESASAPPRPSLRTIIYVDTLRLPGRSSNGGLIVFGRQGRCEARSDRALPIREHFGGGQYSAPPKGRGRRVALWMATTVIAPSCLADNAAARHSWVVGHGNSQIDNSALRSIGSRTVHPRSGHSVWNDLAGKLRMRERLAEASPCSWPRAARSTDLNVAAPVALWWHACGA